jgi:hypothetical protein
MARPSKLSSTQVKLVKVMFQHDICLDKIASIMKISKRTCYRVLQDELAEKRKPIDVPFIKEKRDIEKLSFQQIALLECQRNKRKKPLTSQTIKNHYYRSENGKKC